MTREEAINTLYGMKGDYLNLDLLWVKAKYEALDMAIKALEQEPILDKIRAEIEQEYTKFRNKSDMWNERACGLGTALEIIDKYKAESAHDVVLDIVKNNGIVDL